uniref:Inositol 1,4,5-trisphosphate receptor-interacting protein-like n=1 Tax=Petromyzon marinus TaxID=7757 RepID=A0AAJ7WR12_PETMA|nr:inositol 1,4,5-trisphosphate receptor-interacting protein-like [Petromyzon marinus]
MRTTWNLCVLLVMTCFQPTFWDWRQEDLEGKMDERARQMELQMEIFEHEFASKSYSVDATGKVEKKMTDIYVNILGLDSSLLNRILLLIFFIIYLFFPEAYSVPHDDVPSFESDLVLKLNEDNEVTQISNLPNSDTLQTFYDDQVQSKLDEITNNREFVENFLDDLVDEMSLKQCINTDLLIGTCVSLANSGDFQSPHTFRFLIPLSPPEPYKFQIDVENENKSFTHVGVKIESNDCSNSAQQKCACCCHDCDDDDDTLCLLSTHNSPFMDKGANGCSLTADESLYNTRTNRLIAGKALLWFASLITQGWKNIARKYDFDLSLRDIHSPCALKMSFKSGRKVFFDAIPAIRYNDSEIYLVPSIYSEIAIDFPQLHWSPTFLKCEEVYMKYLIKRLPTDLGHLQSLNMLSYLIEQQRLNTAHRSFQQEAGLKLFHLRTALLHILADNSLTPENSGMEHLREHLSNLLCLLKRCLEIRHLSHAIVGSAEASKCLRIPEVYCDGPSPNVFGRLLIGDHVFQQTRTLFQELMNKLSLIVPEECD